MEIIEKYEEIVKFAKEQGINLENSMNDFYAYLCIITDMRLQKKRLKKDEIQEAIGIVVDAWLNTDNDTDMSIGRISEYVVANFKKAKEMSDWEILEAIVDGDDDGEDW